MSTRPHLPKDLGPVRAAEIILLDNVYAKQRMTDGLNAFLSWLGL